MRSGFWCRLFLLFVVALTMSAPALSLEPVPVGDSVQLGRHLEILTDRSGNMTLEDVMQAPAESWVRSDQEVPSFGFSRNAYWARVTLHNPQAERKTFILEVDYPPLDQVAYYEIRDGVQVKQVRTGDSLPFTQRPVQHRNFLFPLELDHQASATLYFRVETLGSVQLPLNLLSFQAFTEKEQTDLLVHGLYYGIVLVVLLYALFLLTAYRDPIYLAYAYYVFNFALIQMTLQGFGYQYLWSESTWWTQVGNGVFIPLGIAATAFFASRFLRLKELHPRIYRYFLFYLWGGIAVALASLVLPRDHMVRVGALLGAAGSLSALVLSAYSWWKVRSRPAAYFTLAWSVFLFGVFTLALNKMGYVPRNLFTENAAQIGSAVECIILSFALALRLRETDRNLVAAASEAKHANERLLQAEREYRAQLEVKVQERTENLEQALTTVEQLNEELKKLSTTDGLTGAMNRRYFDDTLNRELSQAQRHLHPVSLIMIDIDHFKQINDRYGHLIGDECIRAVVRTAQSQLLRPQDVLCRYGGEELAIILPSTPLEGAWLVAERIRELIHSTPILVGDETVMLTASFGIATYRPQQDPRPDLLLEASDRALYQAKHEGRNRVCAIP